MVNHFFILWDIETNKDIYSELVKGSDCWLGRLLFLIMEVYRLRLHKRIEVIHVGTLKHSKTFRRDDIEKIGRWGE